MTYIGAGILPYFYDKGQAYYILGCDPEGFDSDWGGRPEGAESPVECAAREGAEEMGNRILGDQTAIKAMLSNTRITTHLPITKENGRPYHLFLLNIKDSALWTHREADCRCFSCTFQPNEEKIAIRCFPAQAVYKAVSDGTGIITLGDRQYFLRDVFIKEVKAIPAFQELYAISVSA